MISLISTAPFWFSTYLPASVQCLWVFWRFSAQDVMIITATSALSASRKSYLKRHRTDFLIRFINHQSVRWRPWYSGSALDFWSTGRAINPAPGALLITKYISLAQVVPGQHDLLYIMKFQEKVALFFIFILCSQFSYFVFLNALP